MSVIFFLDNINVLDNSYCLTGLAQRCDLDMTETPQDWLFEVGQSCAESVLVWDF